MFTPRSVSYKHFAMLAVALALPQAAEAQAEDLTILIYQVNDLVFNVRDYPSPVRGVAGTQVRGDMGMGGMGGGMGGMGGGGMFSVQSTMGGGAGLATGRVPRAPGMAPTQITMDDLEETLMSMVEPDSWDQVGGPGAIRQLGTSLVVSQTAAVHQEIQGFLKQLREGSGERKTVRIDARWLLLNSDELDRLTADEEDGPPQIDRKVLAEYTRRPQSIRGLTTCFSGQLVYLISGTQRNVVVSAIPIVGSLDKPEERGAHYASLTGGAHYTFTQSGGMFGGGVGTVGGSGRSVGYQPVVQSPNFGILLEIRPTLIPGGDPAIVDLRSTLTAPAEQHAVDRLSPTARDRLVPLVDRLAIERQELATTLSVPLGQPVLVGGLTSMSPSIGSPRQDPKADARQPQEASAETPQLYLVLELR